MSFSDPEGEKVGGGPPVAVPARPADGHKGTFGTVIVVGGSATMPGAAAMAARAAFRSGAGLVKVAAPRDVMGAVLAIEPSATGVLLEGAERLMDALRGADRDGRAALAVGPGLGGGADAVLPPLLNDGRAMVLDADALNALAGSGRRLRRTGPTVLTPHPGEFGRLARAVHLRFDLESEAGRRAAATDLAKAHEAVVVLKGAGTVVSDGRQAWVNGTGNVAMAAAGSGDVLTGLIAALLAGGMAAWDAARLGVYLHGVSGDGWAREHGDRGLLARELADGLPRAFACAAGRAGKAALVADQVGVSAEPL
ncbi:MAG: NAD(P)H-hydrate dehydratase [Planctomycetota bacterium]